MASMDAVVLWASIYDGVYEFDDPSSEVLDRYETKGSGFLSIETFARVNGECEGPI